MGLSDVRLNILLRDYNPALYERVRRINNPEWALKAVDNHYGFAWYKPDSYVTLREVNRVLAPMIAAREQKLTEEYERAGRVQRETTALKRIRARRIAGERAKPYASLLPFTDARRRLVGLTRLRHGQLEEVERQRRKAEYEASPAGQRKARIKEIRKTLAELPKADIPGHYVGRWSDLAPYILGMHEKGASLTEIVETLRDCSINSLRVSFKYDHLKYSEPEEFRYLKRHTAWYIIRKELNLTAKKRKKVTWKEPERVQSRPIDMGGPRDVWLTYDYTNALAP